MDQRRYNGRQAEHCRRVPLNELRYAEASSDVSDMQYLGIGASLAMVFSPYQQFEGLYSEREALTRGTLFKALDLPFTGERKACR